VVACLSRLVKVCDGSDDAVCVTQLASEKEKFSFLGGAIWR
jgi:hypothetical protein